MDDSLSSADDRKYFGLRFVPDLDAAADQLVFDLVLVAAEQDGRRTGRIRLNRVDEASSSSLIPAFKQCMEPGSVVPTDGWNGYLPLSSEKYVHKVIRKNADIGDSLLRLLKRVASLLKRWLTRTHQGVVRMSHLDYYLDEYTFRFNRWTSKSRGKLFYGLVEQAVAIDPVSRHQIRGGSRNRYNHTM
ncbi:MAG TPA: IS1595 family transposase [Desulfomonilaceae bacterium]|nr:IS1595 family transposase [Desulfomonilaceae bacterium]